MSDKIPRTDAKLKRLTAAQQEKLWAHVQELKSTGTPQNGALLFIKTQFGFSSSAGALSEWLSWYAARQRTGQREQALLGMLERERQSHPEWTEDFLFNEGQRLMTMLTLVEEDPSGWAAIQRTKLDRESAASKEKLEHARIAQKEREIELAARRVSVLERNAAAALAVIEGAKNQGGLTPETLEKIERELKLL